MQDVAFALMISIHVNVRVRLYHYKPPNPPFSLPEMRLDCALRLSIQALLIPGKSFRDHVNTISIFIEIRELDA
jgi:hypothetical protein